MVVLDRSGKQSHNWFCQQIDEIKETIKALNDSLDDNEEVYSNESKKDPKIVSLTLLILFCPILWETIE